MKKPIIAMMLTILLCVPVTACQTDISETHTPIPGKDMDSLQAEPEAPDDIVSVPGAVGAYRANVHQEGVENPWPSIESVETILGSGTDNVTVWYRGHIETEAGQRRNNIINVRKEGGLFDSELELYSMDVPVGIELACDKPVGLPGTLGRVLVIEIDTDVGPGGYTFEIGIEVDGKDYGTVPCTIEVVEAGMDGSQETIRLDQARPYLILYEANLVNEDPSRSVGLWTIASEEADCFEEYAQTAIQAVLDLYNLYKRDFTSVRLIPKDGIEIAYAQANLAADGKGAAGMTGSAPAIEGYWKVCASIDPQLTEQEMAIAELWFDKLPDFPQHNPLSSSSYDAEALRQYIADALNIPYDEVQMPDLEMHEYELDQSFIDWTISFADSRTSGETGKGIALEPLRENVSIGEVGIRSDTARLCIIL